MTVRRLVATVREAGEALSYRELRIRTSALTRWGSRRLSRPSAGGFRPCISNANESSRVGQHGSRQGNRAGAGPHPRRRHRPHRASLDRELPATSAFTGRDHQADRRPPRHDLPPTARAGHQQSGVSASPAGLGPKLRPRSLRPDAGSSKEASGSGLDAVPGIPGSRLRRTRYFSAASAILDFSAASAILGYVPTRAVDRNRTYVFHLGNSLSLTPSPGEPEGPVSEAAKDS